jgi:hypothetical protein
MGQERWLAAKLGPISAFQLPIQHPSSPHYNLFIIMYRVGVLWGLTIAVTFVYSADSSHILNK